VDVPANAEPLGAGTEGALGRERDVPDDGCTEAVPPVVDVQATSSATVHSDDTTVAEVRGTVFILP